MSRAGSADKDIGIVHGTPHKYGYDHDSAVTYDRETFWTRMGVTPESFQRRPPDHKGGDVLNKTLKPRHLHMIAIGGSIGAGFFVGSGSALNRGVSKSLLGEPCFSC
jgi:amino acid transporter